MQTYVGYQTGLLIIVDHVISVKSGPGCLDGASLAPVTQSSELKLDGLAHIVGDGAGAAGGPGLTGNC